MMKLVSIDDGASQDARDFLMDNIALGRSVGMSHLLLGTSLQEAGQEEKAGFHLEQAFNLLPQAPLVANNLAWHLIHQKNPSISRAKSLIDAVLVRYPDVPAYVDTRAHVHLAMKNWKDAVTDFQVSMTQFSTEASVHLGLAEAYINLEMNDLASRHEQIALQLADKNLTTKTAQ